MFKELKSRIVNFFFLKYKNDKTEAVLRWARQEKVGSSGKTRMLGGKKKKKKECWEK